MRVLTALVLASSAAAFGPTQSFSQLGQLSFGRGFSPSVRARPSAVCSLSAQVGELKTSGPTTIPTVGKVRADDLIKWLWNEAQFDPTYPAPILDFFSDDIVYEDMVYKEPFVGKEEVPSHRPSACACVCGVCVCLRLRTHACALSYTLCLCTGGEISPEDKGHGTPRFHVHTGQSVGRREGGWIHLAHRAPGAPRRGQVCKWLLLLRA